MSKKVFIIDDVHLSLVEEIKRIGCEPIYLPTILPKDVPKEIKEAYGLIVRSKLLITKEVMDSAPQLKFIGRAGSGIDNIDLETAQQKGIEVFNAPEGNCDAVAEHTVGMMLSLSNHLVRGNREVRDWLWRREENRGFEVKGKTISIIGFGFMGQAIAQRLQGFDCNILFYDIEEKDYNKTLNVKKANLDQIFEQTDILTIHTNLTGTSKNMINESFLNHFKKDFYLINTSRGKTLVLKDLNHALETGKVKAAALDVLSNEKFATLNEEERVTMEQLFSKENVLFTPHVGGWTVESYEKISLVLAEKMKKVLSL